MCIRDRSKVLSIARIYGLTILCKTNRFPIVDILSIISSETVFNLLSKVRLLGSCNSDNPHALFTFLLYDRSTERKLCNDLFESSLNHIRTMKHWIIVVGEYT